MLDDSNSVVADELMFTSDNEFFKNMSKKDIKKWADTCMEFVYNDLGYYNDRDLHEITDDTPREEEINNYIYEQNYGIDKDYDDRDIDI